MRKIKDIVDLVHKTANYEIPLNQQKRILRKIIRLTQEVWSDNHATLLSELATIDDMCGLNPNYQQFWFECLEFPRLLPRLFDLNGRPFTLGYNELPSDFNNLQLNLNDSNIARFIKTDKELAIFIDQLEDSTIGEVVLTFCNVSSIFYNHVEVEIINLNNTFTILSVGEAPAIDYCLKHLNLPTDLKNANKRIFYIEGQGNQHRSLYIFAESWSIKTVDVVVFE